MNDEKKRIAWADYFNGVEDIVHSHTYGCNPVKACRSVMESLSMSNAWVTQDHWAIRAMFKDLVWFFMRQIPNCSEPPSVYDYDGMLVWIVTNADRLKDQAPERMHNKDIDKELLCLFEDHMDLSLLWGMCCAYIHKKDPILYLASMNFTYKDLTEEAPPERVRELAQIWAVYWSKVCPSKLFKAFPHILGDSECKGAGALRDQLLRYCNLVPDEHRKSNQLFSVHLNRVPCNLFERWFLRSTIITAMEHLKNDVAPHGSKTELLKITRAIRGYTKHCEAAMNTVEASLNA